MRFLFLCLLLATSQAQAAKAVLTWTPPTYNTDGSALTNLAGYKVLYRVKGQTVWKVKTVANAGSTGTTVWNLLPGTWEFAVKSYTNTGVQSVRTGIVSVTL